MLYDVIIIGGGPAGLNAAIVLGRCKRKVLVFDSGQYRNERSKGMHNYLTRDGILPGEFLEMARWEVKQYGVEIQKNVIVKADKNTLGLFTVEDENGTQYQCKRLLLATGLTDKLPQIPGIEDYYGVSIHHCPYCDGWESRDKKISLYAKNKNGSGMAVALKTWSNDITLLTDGKNYLKPEEKETLSYYNIPVITTPIKTLQGSKGYLESISFMNGESIVCDVLFFTDRYKQHCSLVYDLNCTISSKGVVKTNKLQQTNVPGLYVAGDAARDMHLVVVAAAEGAKAGTAINMDLQKEERPGAKKRQTAISKGNMQHSNQPSDA